MSLASSSRRLRTWVQLVRSLCDTSYFRQASTIAFIFLLVTLLAGLGGRFMLESVMLSHVREMVLADVQTQQLLGMQNVEQARESLRVRDGIGMRNDRKVLLLGPDRALAYGDASLLSAISCQGEECAGWRSVDWRDGQGRHVELLGLGVRLRDGGMYFSSYDMQPMMERLGILPLIGGALLFIVLLLSTGIGLAFGMDSLKRLDVIRSILRRYVAGNSAVRAAIGPQNDEIDRLGENINQALGRINHMMGEVKSVSSHIAHELGTPLTRLKNRLSNVMELANDSALQQEIALAVEEAERIQTLSRAILRLGEIESGLCQRQFDCQDASSLVRELADYYQPLAELRGNPLTVVSDPHCLIYGDWALLMQALSNLIDNALKYAVPGTPVIIFARQRGEQVELGVKDRGPGIPRDQRESTLLRFNRLKQTANVPGHGLGLTLVQAIARLHGGDVIFEENDRPENGSPNAGITILMRLQAFSADRAELSSP